VIEYIKPELQLVGVGSELILGGPPAGAWDCITGTPSSTDVPDFRPAVE